jgi:hypothetical protein
VYVKFSNPADIKEGAVYSIFRMREAVTHPTTKRAYGYQTLLLGSMKIVGRDGDAAIGELQQVSEDVKRGDRVGPGAALARTVRPLANEKELSGVIVATDITQQTWIGENHVVFVDKGAKDGVQQGNTFDVVQAGDGLEKMPLKGPTMTSGLPVEVVAELMVIDVREDASAAMVVKSVREVGVGDKVEMHPASLIPGAGGDAF